MTTSKYGKSYDTSDGSEQHHEATTQQVRSDGGQAARQRWEDDGGLISDCPSPLVFAEELTSKPAWSVQSLHDLNQAIRRANDPVRLRAEEAQRVERQRVRAIGALADKVANAARAERNRYRNAWEHID